MKTLAKICNVLTYMHKSYNTMDSSREFDIFFLIFVLALYVCYRAVSLKIYDGNMSMIERRLNLNKKFRCWHYDLRSHSVSC